MDHTEDKERMVYAAVKEIVDTVEGLKHARYEEALENNWMSDYTDYANKLEHEAYEKIKGLTKD
jgi:hypothetical protein